MSPAGPAVAVLVRGPVVTGAELRDVVDIARRGWRLARTTGEWVGWVFVALVLIGLDKEEDRHGR